MKHQVFLNSRYVCAGQLADSDYRMESGMPKFHFPLQRGDLVSVWDFHDDGRFCAVRDLVQMNGELQLRSGGLAEDQKEPQVPEEPKIRVEDFIRDEANPYCERKALAFVAGMFKILGVPCVELDARFKELRLHATHDAILMGTSCEDRTSLPVQQVVDQVTGLKFGWHWDGSDESFGFFT